MNKKWNRIAALVFFVVYQVCAPIAGNGQNVGIGTQAPNSKAMLDISSTSRGILIPRMTSQQKNTISNPPKGLMVFVNTDSSFHYYNGSSWVRIAPESETWLLTGNEKVTGKFLGTKDTSAFRLITRNIERFTIDSSGKIGIHNPNPATGIHMVDNGNNQSDLYIEYNTNSNGFGGLVFGKSRGTPSAKLKVEAGTTLGGIYFNGYSQSDTYNGYVQGASIYARTFSDFSLPDRAKIDLIFFAGNRDNGVSLSSNMIFTHNGRLGINTYAPIFTLDARGKNPDDGALLQIANSDQTQRVLLYSGRLNDPNPYMQWRVGSSMRFTTDEGGFKELMRIGSNGNVGIGLVNPLEKLHVAGNIIASGTITPSDERYKRDIQPLENALDLVNRLQGVSYWLKPDEFPDMGFSSTEQVGLIAQNVEQVLPQVVYTGSNGYKGVDYAKIVPLLVEAIKQNKQEQDELRAEVKQLNDELKMLKRRKK